MLDPSAFFRPRDEFLRALDDSRSTMNVRDVYTPGAAITALENGDDSATLRALGGAIAGRFDPGTVLATIRESGVVSYERPDYASAEFFEMRERLQTIEPINALAEIRFDEWLYLTRSSTVVSRLKRPFSQLARAGALVIELATPVRDRVVRRTLKLDELEPVTRAHSLRALGKWTAVGGDAALAFIAPWIAAPVAPGS